MRMGGLSLTNRVKPTRINSDGIPTYYTDGFDNAKVVKIKAAKNLISAFNGMKLQGHNPTKDQIENYHLAISILKQEKETYP